LNASMGYDDSNHFDPTEPCRPKCEESDCEITYYTFADKLEDFNQIEETFLEVSPSKAPIIEYHLQPRREFMEFIDNFISACDLWLDLVAILGIGSLMAQIRKFLESKKIVPRGEMSITERKLTKLPNKVRILEATCKDVKEMKDLMTLISDRLITMEEKWIHWNIKWRN